MKLFTVGPVEMYPETLQVSGTQLPYFRNDEFSSIMKENEQQLLTLCGCRKGRALFLCGSGSAAMEAVVACSFRRQDKVLILRGGSFGERFVQLCRIYGIPYDELCLQELEALRKEHLDAFFQNEYCALLVNLHETSTGQLYDIQLLSAFTKAKNMYLIVDAISSFMADPLDMDQMGIDVLILSSQKALALSCGLSMVVLQESFYRDMVEPKDDICLYLSLKEHARNMERGQTPNTPAVGILMELHERLQHLQGDGFVLEQQRIATRAAYFRSRVQKLEIQLPHFPLSNALTPLLFDGDAQKVYQFLKKNYAITLTPSGGAMRERMLRVGHLGNLKLCDYSALCDGLREYGK